MFSYFRDGIKDKHPQQTIDLPELVRIIKNNPNQSKIEQIRLLKKEGDKRYKELKSELPNITPNCVVKERNLDVDLFSANFLFSSKYIYFDFDSKPDILMFKTEFIKKYGHQASLVCISSGGDGLSVLFKVGITINNKEDFEQAREYIRTTILKDEVVDPKCSDIGRAMFISSDPDVFYNYDNILSIDTRITFQIKKSINQPISSGRGNNRLNETFSIIPIREVLRVIKLKTEVKINKPVVDVIPIDIAEVKFPRGIRDGTKHRIYTGMIHSLVYLNPEVKSEYLFSYLHFINNNFANPSMEFRELSRLFNYEYSKITNDKNYIYGRQKVKYVHFNSKSGLTGDEKRCVASLLNGQKRKNESIEKIVEAREELVSQGKKVTQKRIAELSGLSLTTVKRHYNKGMVDLNEIIESIEDSLTTNFEESKNSEQISDKNQEL